ncbi:hypothetical protein T439DRAFT_166370 [Meredithblackwellia eburnea MCA 4105]
MDYPNMSEERMKALYESFTQGGRPIEELLKGDPAKDKLKGAEGQRLRSHFASYSLHPADCEDFELVSALMTANVPNIRRRWLKDLQEAGGGTEGKIKTREKWEKIKQSPNLLPIYDILLVGAYTRLLTDGTIPPNYYEAIEYLISLGISVEGIDLAGHTALHHAAACTPLAFDQRMAELFLNASKDPIAAINNRNRFGGTVLHSCVMSFARPGENELRLRSLKWLLDNGANADIPDMDGATPRFMANKVFHAPFAQAFKERDQERLETMSCCFCRRGGKSIGKGKGKVEDEAPPAPGEVRATLRCSRCKTANYCSARCQKLAWSAHKSKCVTTS